MSDKSIARAVAEATSALNTVLARAQEEGLRVDVKIYRKDAYLGMPSRYLVETQTFQASLDSAAMSETWREVASGLPPAGTRVEILHFGYGDRAYQIEDIGIVDKWGTICPDNRDGGHGKRSTVTHWRPIPGGPEQVAAATLETPDGR